MIKILHTGDIHLGDLAGPTKDGANLRRQDPLRCMDAIVNKARTEGPTVTIIAGDLFNRSRVWADTALDDVNDAISRFIVPLCEYSDAVVLLFGTTVMRRRRYGSGRGRRRRHRSYRGRRF